MARENVTKDKITLSCSMTSKYEKGSDDLRACFWYIAVSFPEFIIIQYLGHFPLFSFIANKIMASAAEMNPGFASERQTLNSTWALTNCVDMKNALQFPVFWFLHLESGNSLYTLPKREGCYWNSNVIMKVESLETRK